MGEQHLSDKTMSELYAVPSQQVGKITFGTYIGGPGTSWGTLGSPGGLGSYFHEPDALKNSLAKPVPPTVSVFRREDPVTEFVTECPDLPERKTTEAYCYDICAFLPGQQSLVLKPLTVTRVPTGLYLALPEHWAALVCSRSGLAAKGVQVINAPGVIDSDYRDEVCVLLSYIAPPDSEPFVIEHGTRIAQLLYLPPTPMLITHEVGSRSDLPMRDTTRTGGFGSTGV